MTWLLIALLVGCTDTDTDTDTDTEGDTDLGTDSDTTPPGAPALEEIGRGFTKPVVVTRRPGSDRWYVVEQTGRVRTIGPNGEPDTTFLDLTAAVTTDGWEQGLLGLAFPPDHATTGQLFVHFTRPDGASVVARFRVSASDRTVADPSSREDLWVLEQPYENHNGGHLAFGPDGYLYVGYGDGGWRNDPQGNGQDATTWLGSMLRVDVSGDHGYAIPADNPFVGTADVPDEIWAIGLRNPWKYTFDRATGDLWIADVGQNTWEEINRQPATSTGGENYGWNVMEGAHCFQANSCDQTGLVLPVREYGHGPACSITGGYVYRGDAIPEWSGQYVFADFCSDQVWTFDPGTATTSEWTSILDPDGLRISGIATFGEDDDGELVIAMHNTGRIYRVIRARR